MAFSVLFSRTAQKQLEKIPDPFYSSLKETIYQLSENPRPQGYLKLKGRVGYRVRVGNYRIIYEIQDNKLIIEIIAIGHRKDIYD